MDEQTISQIPFYSVQGVVQAVEIADIIQTAEGVTIYPTDINIEPFGVTREYLKMTGATKGGYFLKYSKGNYGYITKDEYTALNLTEI